MAGVTGLNWKISVDIDDGGSTDWQVLPQQRGGSLSFSKSDVDASNKDNAGWETSLSTRRGWTFSVDGIWEDNNSGLNYLVDTNQLGTATDYPVGVKLENSAGDTYIGSATMDSYELDAPESDLVSYSISFTGRGALALTRA